MENKLKVTAKRRKKVTKQRMLNELMDLIEAFNAEQEYINNFDATTDEAKPLFYKPTDKIAAIKQICLMEGFNAPEQQEILHKEYVLEF